MNIRTIDPDSAAARACRRGFIRLARRTRLIGLDPLEVDRSRGELSRLDAEGRRWLKKIAYEPTGLALGHPLPDRHLERRLWRVTRWIDRGLRQLLPDGRAPFAFVPPEAYHLTVVGRSHFDTGSATATLSSSERIAAQRALGGTCRAPLRVHFCGLILGRDGRLIACGFPADERIFGWRRLLRERMPEVSWYAGPLAAVKLGHVTANVVGRDLHSLLGLVHTAGAYVCAVVEFHQIHTPAGPLLLRDL